MKNTNIKMYYWKLKNSIINADPGTKFFSHENLKFFGVRESESRVLNGTVKIIDILGQEHDCYVLSERQRNAPAGVPQRYYSYWDISTFEQIFPAL